MSTPDSGASPDSGSSSETDSATTSTPTARQADAAPGTAPATATETSPAPRSASQRTPRSNGQWKVDGTKPLNHNEELKAEDNGLNVRQRIIDVYSKQGFSSIAPDDLHGRMRWWGLYTQRKQGIEGSRTSKLDADELSDEYFMMRIRSDGGDLTLEQLRAIGTISKRYARDTADISDRQNIQLHWVRVEDVPTIWDELAAVGLDTTEACGDTPRVILGSPVAGIAADELLDPTPQIEQIKARYVGNPDFANLPRKFKSAITGHPSQDVVHEINDVSFVAVEHPELGLGYDLWVGGGLSTAPQLAKRVGVFVAPDEVPDVWGGVISIFRDYGYRRLRTKARLKFLVKDWGVEKFRQVLQEEYLQRELPDGPPPAPPTRSGDHVGVHEQRNGKNYVGLAPVVGRLSGTRLLALADAAEQAGSDRVRLTPHQKVVVLDIDPERTEAFIAAAAELDLVATPSPFRRATMACTGIEYCKLAFVETKGLAAGVISELEQRLSDVSIDPPISLHVNGCPNSCARIQTADIGLKGVLIDGDEFGFQVHLGGGLASQNREDPGLGRTVRGVKVKSVDIPDYVERVVRNFTQEQVDGETFATWAHRADEEQLR